MSNLTVAMEIVMAIACGILMARAWRMTTKVNEHNNKFEASTKKWDYINGRLAEFKTLSILILNNETEYAAALDEVEQRQEAIAKLQALDPINPEAPWNNPPENGQSYTKS